jgi:hypothetical protein
MDTSLTPFGLICNKQFQGLAKKKAWMAGIILPPAHPIRFIYI